MAVVFLQIILIATLTRRIVTLTKKSQEFYQEFPVKEYFKHVSTITCAGQGSWSPASPPRKHPCQEPCSPGMVGVYSLLYRYFSTYKQTATFRGFYKKLGILARNLAYLELWVHQFIISSPFSDQQVVFSFASKMDFVYRILGCQLGRKDIRGGLAGHEHVHLSGEELLKSNLRVSLLFRWWLVKIGGEKPSCSLLQTKSQNCAPGATFCPCPPEQCGYISAAKQNKE